MKCETLQPPTAAAAAAATPAVAAAVAAAAASPSPPRMFADSYVLDWKSRPLGIGVNGPVFACTERGSGQRFAVKFLKDTPTSQREIACWRKCGPHPHIIALHDVFSHELLVPGFDLVPKRRLIVVMELAEHGELFYHIRSSRRLPEADAGVVTAQLALALSHIHSLGITHRDVKVGACVYLCMCLCVCVCMCVRIFVERAHPPRAVSAFPSVGVLIVLLCCHVFC
jgi:hypothetical protein